MANAREMLNNIPRFQEGGEVEPDPFPTIRESLAELGANPDKYESILAKTDDKLHWEKVFRPKTTLEAGAITLLAAAKQSGAEPNEYLSRLAPYFESRIQSLPDLYNVLGYVDPRAPSRAVLTRTAREDKGSASTLPHELEHTLQKKDADARYKKMTNAALVSGKPFDGLEHIDHVKVPGRPDPVLRFGGMDSLKGDLQKRLSELPEEERNLITAEHPVFGRYLSRGNELFARIRAKDMLDSAKGQDFLQTELGQKLFPTDRDRSYFIGSTLPNVPKISPPYTFESTEEKKKPVTNPNTSYARQLFNKLTAPKEFQEGGEVTQEDSPDLAKALAVLESDPLKYKSMYQYLLTKGDIANLNDQNLAKEDIAALGLVHAARLSNTEPEAFIENLRPSMQNLQSKKEDVRPNVMLQGSSGGFNTRMPGMNFDMPYVPATLMGRAGVDADIGQDTVRAGLVAGGAYIPNMGVMLNPVRADVGYRTPFAGGALNVGVSTSLQNPSAKNTNVMAHYSRRFAEGGEVTDEFPEEAGVMPDQNPSEAAKRLLYYKKTAAPSLPPGVIPDTGQLDGMYQEPTVASETARIFGMQPREDRGSILPIYKSNTGLVAPDWMYDIARNATAADMARRGYAVAPEEGVNMALNFTGAGLGTSTLMRKPMGEGGVDLAMNAYHGSPYNIAGKFDVSKAGTGTGAKQYGHGVYFAEARPTAERFKKGAKQKGFDFQAEEKALGIELPTNARSHFMILSQQMPDNPALKPADAAELILSKNPEARNIPKEKLANLFQTYQEKTQGNLYQVDIPDAQVAKMLDWNKPLSEQSPEVLDILKKIPAIQEDLRAGKTLEDLKGGNAYQALAASFNVRQNEAYKLASDFLNAQGIPGVRYDDYYAPGQSNFVVFDPSMVQMLMRNDKPVSTLPSSTTAKEDLAKVEAPSIMTRSGLTELSDYIKNREGGYGLRRVERAADEIPNLEKLYALDALRSAFSGDNARALMTMNPADFEKYAAPLLTNLSQQSKDNIANLKTIQGAGGFSDVPFFLVNKELAGSTGLPWITGHEGRHRSRAMDAAGVQSGLVQFLPRAELREPFPRRSQEQYIDAIRKEMALSGNKIKPEKYYLNETDEKSFQRPAIDLPDIYAKGGEVRKPKEYQEGGEVEMPEEQASPVTEAAKRLLYYKKTAAPTPPTDIARLGKQAGLIGLGFAPGAGVADYFGKFPAVEGGTEPSAVENFQKGNYGTAALQGLGAMGDLAMAVPVAGTAIGSVMKAPRAAQKMLQELKGSRVVDQSGEPLTVYHGTNTKNIKEFDTAKKGAWFSEDPYIAEAYTRREGADAGTIVSAKINVKNPLVVPKDIDMSKRYSVEEIINRINDDNATTYVPKDFGLKPNTEVPAFDVVSSPRFIKELKKGGFDGIKAYEGGYSTWNVFDNKQITRDSAKDISKPVSTLPSSTTAKEDLANVPGVLPKAERDANLNKMLEKSVVKEPVYHSTYSDFPEFKTNFGEDEYFQFGAHVGSVDAASNRLSLKQAEDAARGAKGSDTGANIMPVYAKITNPLRLDENRTGRWGVDDIMSTIMEKADAGDIKGIPPNIVDDFFDDNLQIEKFLGKKVKGEPRVWQNTMDWQPGERSKLLTEFIEKLGHDGIVYNNLFEGGGDSYLVLRPTQLKSATGNKGTYDTESPVLNKAKGGEVRKPK